MKKTLNPYYNHKYFEAHDLLDIHLAYSIALILKKQGFKRIVDVGCGTGQLVRYLNKQGYTAFGCEPATIAYELAKKNNKPRSIYKTIADRLPFADQSMDMVCAISVIEHLTPQEVDRFLTEAKRILIDYGMLFLVTPNYKAVWKIIQGKKWFGYSDPTHINFFTPSSLTKELTKHGFNTHSFQFDTLLDPPYSWELPSLLGKLPKIIKQLLTFLLISSPLWKLRNSFWISAVSFPSPPHCQICKGNTKLNFRVHLHHKKYAFYKCYHCGLVFIDPHPLKKLNENFQATDLYDHAVKTNPQLRTIDLIGGKRIIKLYSNWCNFLRMKTVTRILKGGEILDVGCGEGEFLKYLPQTSWKLSGIEENHRLARIASKLTKAHILKGAIEKIPLKSNYYDVVTLWHVFEHISQPRILLKKLKRILKFNGYLILEVPHGQSFYSQLFGPYWQTLIPPEHLYLWSKKSLNQLLKQSGFIITKISYTGILSFSGSSSVANWLRSKKIPSFAAVSISFLLFPLVLFLNVVMVKGRENIQVIARKL